MDLVICSIHSTWLYSRKRGQFDLVEVAINGRKVELETVIRGSGTFEFSILEPVADTREKQLGLFGGK